MTKEEAKEFIVQSVKSNIDIALVADAIKALSQEPCDDAISRQAYIERFRKWGLSEFGRKMDNGALAIRVAMSLPSVNPQYTGNEFFNFDAPMVKKSMEQDAISREAVLNLCTNGSYKIPYEYEDDKGIHRGYDEYRLINYYKLKLLPPVTPQPSEHFIDGVHAIGYREGYKDAQKQKSGKWDRLYNWLNDMRLGIAPDETVDDIDERHCREAQTDILDEIMEWMIKAESEDKTE